MKRVFIIHGWGGHPEEGWFLWLKKELEKKGFTVEVPSMPDTNNPKIDAWVQFLAKLVGKPDKDTVLVGHSVGCQTIMRYLEKSSAKVSGVVFVGGWFTLYEENLENDEERAIIRPWLTTPIDTDRVKMAANKVIAILSDNDKWVPLDNQKMFEQRLGAKTIVVKNKGHMGGDDNCTELPEALDAVLSLSR